MLSLGNSWEGLFAKRRESMYDPQNYLTNPCQDLVVERSLRVEGENPGVAYNTYSVFDAAIGNYRLLNIKQYASEFRHGVRILPNYVGSNSPLSVWSADIFDNINQDASFFQVNTTTSGQATLFLGSWRDDGSGDWDFNNYWEMGYTATGGSYGNGQLVIQNTYLSTAKIAFVNPIQTSKQIISTLATGTSPLSVTSTTLNTNLNADLLDGNHATAFATALGADDNYVTDTEKTNIGTLTNDSMADSLHRHSELSASDGSPNPALYVDATGLVGIGTTSPGAKLQVVGDLSSNVAEFRGDSSNTNLNSQYSHFEMSNRNQTNNNFALFSFSGHPTIGFASAGILTVFGSHADIAKIPGDMLFYTRNLAGSWGERVRISTEGNVGIGTTAPSTKLHVLITTEQLRLGYDASNYKSETIGSTGTCTTALTGTSPINDFSQAVKFSGGTQSSDGSAGISVTITTAALTLGGAQGSMTFKNGLLTAQTAAT